MKHLGVIEKVTTFTSWISSMVTLVKVRICIDLCDLNNAIDHNHKPTYTIEDIFTRMTKATIFSVLDASSGCRRGKCQTVPSTHHSGNVAMFKCLPFGFFFSKSDVRVLNDLPAKHTNHVNK